MNYSLLFGFASASSEFVAAMKAKNEDGWTLLPPVQESWNATENDMQLLATFQKLDEVVGPPTEAMRRTKKPKRKK